jgi:hypothetical protein
MEVNKDEALRCVEKAQQLFNGGDYDRAQKFVTKSLGMFPTGMPKAIISFPTRKRSYLFPRVYDTSLSLNNSFSNESFQFLPITLTVEARALAAKIEAAKQNGSSSTQTSSPQVRYCPHYII